MPSVEVHDGVTVVPKRGRGRPRKKPLPSVQVNQDQQSLEPIGGVRRSRARGRVRNDIDYNNGLNPNVAYADPSQIRDTLAEHNCARYLPVLYAMVNRKPTDKLTDIAKRCGIALQTLLAWKRDPIFYQLYYKICRDEWRDNYGRVFQTLLRKCDEGDIQAIKLFMQIGGLAPVQNDDVPVHEQPKTVDVSKLTPEQRQVMYDIARSQGLIAGHSQGQQKVEPGTGPDIGQGMDQDGPNLGSGGAQDDDVIDLEPILGGSREDELEGKGEGVKPASKPGRKVAYELETSLFK